MKKIALVIVLFAFAGLCFAADLVEGYWLSVDEKTEKVTAGWTVYQEDGKLYGKILSAPDGKKGDLAKDCKASYAGFPVAGDVSKMPMYGTPWIFGLTMNKPGDWSGGSIIDPQEGKMYKCKIIFHAADGKKYKTDTLEMRGEIGLGIGRSQFWRKSDLEKASNLW
jgi:uncharacterized protein (DUF2147 family)